MPDQSLHIKIGLQFLELLNSTGRGGALRKNIVGQGTGLDIRLRDGTGNHQLDLGYFRDLPTAIAASGNQDFDLAGSLTDSFGNTITMAEVVGIMVFNWNTAGTLTLRAGASNGLTSVFTANSAGMLIGPAAVLTGIGTVPGFNIYYAPGGRTVTAGTGDKINLLNDDSSNAANYTIGLFGRSA